MATLSNSDRADEQCDARNGGRKVIHWLGGPRRGRHARVGELL
jgi:hypothetical protein